MIIFLERFRSEEMQANFTKLSSTSLSGAYSEGVIPSSIPNLAVKPLSADNTAPLGCGKVGRRRARGFPFYNSSNT